jgi:hypothetical protein
MKNQEGEPMTKPLLLSTAGGRQLDRRGFLAQTATGLGGIALAHLLDGQGLLAAETAAVRQPIRHHAPKARNVLVVFCSGALSHVDTWDYKPELIKHHDQPLPAGQKVVTFQSENGNLIKSPWAFKPRGQSGKYVSELVPHLADLADEMCFIHSLTSKTNTHGPGETFLSTGFTLEGFPSMGAWVGYALGSAVDDLPAFVAIPDPRGVPQASATNWGAGFLPAVHQGTAFNAVKPVRNLRPPAALKPEAYRATRDYLKLLNDRHLERNPGDAELAARIASYELAGKMQISIPRLTDLSDEPAYVLREYGADDAANGLKAGFARNCILARRLIERGVRFVQLFNGAYGTAQPGDTNWDAHGALKAQYEVHGPVLDQPVAALLRDLKRRGLLDETLLVFCTEFGRMPFFQKGAQGRDHNPDGFTCWLAGAGVKRAFSYGATDEFGHRAVEKVATIHDFHATILHLLGIDHKRLTFYHNGIQRRLTDVHGNVLYDLLA